MTWAIRKMCTKIIWWYLLTILNCVSTGSVHYTICDDTSSYTITDVRINCIGTPTPCILARGYNYTIQIDFTTPDLSSFLPYAASVATDQLVSYEISTGDASKNLTFKNVPLTKAKSYTFQNVLVIPPEFPQIKTEIFFFMWDNKFRLAMCIQVDVEIKSSSIQNVEEDVKSLPYKIAE